MTDETNNEVVEASVETSQETAPTINPKEFEEIKAENERLKAFHDKVTKEKAEAVAKAKAEADRLAKEKAESEGNWKELLEMKEKEYQSLLAERDTKLTAYEQEQKERAIMDTARSLANELAKSNPGKAALLAKELRSRLQLTEDGIKVVDDKGKLLSDKLDVLKDFAKKNYDFLCDGVQSTGGAGVVVGKPTETQNRTSDPADRINAALGLNII